MYIIAGLGNPGNKYKNNRHNIGFMILDKFVLENSLNDFKKKKNFFYSLNKIDKTDVIFIKPTTYMNNSGKAIVAAMAFFKVKPSNIVVIMDDVALPIGKIRIREKGSDGGHNGLKSVEDHIGTINYKRIRIGIGAPEMPGQMVSHVLGDLELEEQAIVNNKIYPNIEDCLTLIINNKIKEAMNKYNGLGLKENSD